MNASEDQVQSPKRAAILAAASRVILDVGYGAATMDEIARVAGVAKQTVYSHFGGKAALFEAMIAANCGRMLASLDTCETTTLDPAERLKRVAKELLALVLAPETLARFRVVMAESARFPELTEIYYRTGPGRATAALAAYLADLHGEGVLEVADPRLAASQFFGMVRGDLFLRGLLGLETVLAEEEIETIADVAVQTFLSAHQPSTLRPSPPGRDASAISAPAAAAPDRHRSASSERIFAQHRTK